MKNCIRASSILAVLTLILIVGDVTGVEAQTIDACFVPASGTIYVIKLPGTPEACHSDNHVAVSWSQSGLPGPAGPVGPAGPEGDAGPAGPAGTSALTGIAIHSEGVTLPTDGRFRASCPTGQSVVNFGYEFPPLSSATTASIRSSRPAINGPTIEWSFQATPGTDWTFYWICADAGAAVLAP